MSIEVRIQSLLRQDNSKIYLKVNPAQTVDSLISAYCIEKGIRQRTDYVLTSALNDVLYHTASVGSAGIQNGDTLYLKCESVDEGKTFGCNNWWLVATICILIGTVGIITVSVIITNQPDEPLMYGVVFDAGSTHTKSFVYNWKGSKSNGTGVVLQDSSCSVEGPALAHLRHKVSSTLKTCITNSASRIPSTKRASTSVYLGATAGMRVLNATDPNMADLILGEVRDSFSSSGLSLGNKLVQVRIISGSEEGSFGWITVNYLLGTFGNFVQGKAWDVVPSSPSSTVGALDMGGASLQITYVPSNTTTDMPMEQTSHLKLFGQDYTVYTTSFLCYGKMEAERRLLALLVKEQNYSPNITNPCAPAANSTIVLATDVFKLPCTSSEKDIAPGTSYTFHGTSNSTQCREKVDKLVNTTSCQYKQCAFDDIYMPELYGSFIAFNSFMFVVLDLNLTTGSPPEQGLCSLKEFRAATNSLCSKSYDEMKTITSMDESYWTKLCFDSHYIDIILTKGFKFTEEYWRTHLYFKRQIRHFEVGWTLGFMINATNSFPVNVVTQQLSTFAFALLLALFILFLLAAIGFACHARRAKGSKGPYKQLSQGGNAYGSI